MKVKPKRTKEQKTEDLLKAQRKKITQKKAMVLAYIDDFKRDDGSVNVYGLAKKTGISYPTIRKYLEGLKELNQSEITQIAQWLKKLKILKRNRE